MITKYQQHIPTYTFIWKLFVTGFCALGRSLALFRRKRRSEWILDGTELSWWVQVKMVKLLMVQKSGWGSPTCWMVFIKPYKMMGFLHHHSSSIRWEPAWFLAINRRILGKVMFGEGVEFLLIPETTWDQKLRIPQSHQFWLVVSNIFYFSPLFGEDSHFD